jgi:putative membrane protein
LRRAGLKASWYPRVIRWIDPGLAVKIERFAVTWLLLFASAMSAAFGQDARLSDAQIVGILLVANDAEIAAGQIALRKSQSKSVQAFAARMVDEHRQVNQEAAAMLQRIGASAARSDLSDSITRQTRRDLTMLNDADEYNFDDAYLDREVEFLGQLVRSVDGYIRTAVSPDLKVLLVRARPAYTFHLDQAHRLQLVMERPGFGR